MRIVRLSVELVLRDGIESCGEVVSWYNRFKEVFSIWNIIAAINTDP